MSRIPALNSSELRNVESKLKRTSLRGDDVVTLHVWEVEALVSEVRSMRNAIQTTTRLRDRRNRVAGWR